MAVSEIKLIEKAILDFCAEAGQLPNSLNDIIRLRPISSPWNRSYQYLRIDGGTTPELNGIRRNFLICKDIQLRLATYNLLFLLFALGVIMATALIPLYMNFEHPDSLWSQHFSANFFLVITDRLVLAFAGVFAVAFIFRIVVTHRFAGPLISFSKTFQKISQGDLTRKISLRRKDFLHREASQVNAMTDALIDL